MSSSNSLMHAAELVSVGGVDLLKDAIGALSPAPMPDIATFAEDTLYCGKSLYPRQLTALKMIFCDLENMTAYDHKVIKEWLKSSEMGGDVKIPLDIYSRMQYLRDNGYQHFREVVMVGGRRGSKGHLGGIMAAWKTLEMTTLDDPQWYFGIDPEKDLYGYVLATTKMQTLKYLYADVSRTIEGCRALDPFIVRSQGGEIRVQSPADRRRLAKLKVAGIQVDRDVASIRVMAAASNAAGVRGGAAFFEMYDEFAHFLETGSAKSGSEVYNALVPSLNQVKKKALIYHPSSPWTKTGKFYELYRLGLLPYDADDGQPDILVIQFPSWELYRDWDTSAPKGKFVGAIIEYDDSARRLEQRDPEMFRVEFRAQFAETIDAYLTPEAVDAIFRPWPNEQYLELQDKGSFMYVYEGHADPSKVNANFAIAIGHAEKDAEGLLHVVFDFLHVYQPHEANVDPTTGQRIIDYLQIERDIVDLLRRFPNTREFSFDQFNSVGAIQHIREGLRRFSHIKTKITERTFTKSSNWERNEVFKTACNMGWVHAPQYIVDHPELGDINLLEFELKFLTEKNGRIDKQAFGPIRTKDLSDAVMEVTFRLLEAQVREQTGKQLSSLQMTGVTREPTVPNSHSGQRTYKDLSRSMKKNVPRAPRRRR